jgi:hypothetical protein
LGGFGAGTAGSGGPAGGAGGSGGIVAPPPLIDGGVDAGGRTFSELHEAELTKDCQESVQCLMQRAEPLEPDALSACLEDSAILLDGNEALHARFLANVERCRDLVVCDYYDCAISAP